MIEIYERRDGSASWVVEHVTPLDDGICEVAIFSGPEAERQARAFAQMEYSFETQLRVTEDDVKRFMRDGGGI